MAFDPLNVFSVCSATRDSKWLEREERAQHFYEKQLEERRKKLEEQRLREERRRAAVEEKRRQRLEEDQVSLQKNFFGIRHISVGCLYPLCVCYHFYVDHIFIVMLYSCLYNVIKQSLILIGQ